jgi:leucyl-tRNA synthetase
MDVDAGISKEDLQAAALANAKVVELLAGQTPRNVIVVPPKLVNIVV